MTLKQFNTHIQKTQVCFFVIVTNSIERGPFYAQTDHGYFYLKRIVVNGFAIETQKCREESLHKEIVISLALLK